MEARQNWGGENGLVSFDCTLWDAENEERIAGARLNCLLPSDAELQEIVRRLDEYSSPEQAAASVGPSHCNSPEMDFE